MAYGMEQLQSGIKYLADAGQAGRRSLDGVMSPVNGAISEISGAAGELEGVPFVGPEVGAKLQRLMRGVTAAQSQVNAVVSTYSTATRALAGIDERMATLKDQASRAAASINKVAGKLSPSLASILPTGTLASATTPGAEAVKAFPHLMVLQPITAQAAPFFFNLDTAAFNELRRQTAYRWASQERLTRRPARQAVGVGDEKLTLKGAIFPLFKGGIRQLDTLRSIAGQLVPLSLTTGYGDVLGTWCLENIEEEQSNLLQGGLARKQAFTLEFSRYGDDLQNLSG